MESLGEAALTTFQGAEAVRWEMVEDRRHGGREKGEGKMKMSIFSEQSGLEHKEMKMAAGSGAIKFELI